MVDGVNSSIMYLIYFKNFCKCHNVSPHPAQQKKEIDSATLMFWGLIKFLEKLLTTSEI
jgi:hypothetical protein